MSGLLSRLGWKADWSLYRIFLLLWVLLACVCFCEPLICSARDGIYCPGESGVKKSETNKIPDEAWPNPSYPSKQFSRVRHPALMMLSIEDCDFGRRVVLSLILGSMIGLERRLADAPAGMVSNTTFIYLYIFESKSFFISTFFFRPFVPWWPWERVRLRYAVSLRSSIRRWHGTQAASLRQFRLASVFWALVSFGRVFQERKAILRCAV